MARMRDDRQRTWFSPFGARNHDATLNATMMMSPMKMADPEAMVIEFESVEDDRLFAFDV